MDPNETLERLQTAVREWRAFKNPLYADDMAEAAQALDEWLSAGGFLPDAWERK